MVTELWILYTHGGNDRYSVYDFNPDCFEDSFREPGKLLMLETTNGSRVVLNPAHVIGYSYRTKSS